MSFFLSEAVVCKASISAFNTSFVKNITAHNKEIKSAQAPPQVASQVPPQTPSSGAPPQASPRRGPPQAPSSRIPPQVPAGAPPKDAPPGAPPQASPRRGPPQTPSSGAPPQASPRRGPPQTPSSGAPPQASPRRGPPQTPSSGAPPQASPRRGPPQAPSSRVPPQAPAGAPPKPYAQASTKEPQGSGNETQHPHLTPAAKVVGHLYGVFQLSDQLACDSGVIPSLNVCNITCSGECFSYCTVKIQRTSNNVNVWKQIKELWILFLFLETSFDWRWHHRWHHLPEDAGELHVSTTNSCLL